ncbi:MAG: mannose-1-phosphate guanylyltransferase [Candidatus Levybacteria bacterium]|nr:mannose-1-phosphate guanylyltransferase [Candidatus Levybacteria bacterium]
MKIVIFAGGVGTRLWPLSRKNTPKQFEKIIDNKSTLQKTVERLLPDFKLSDIYIATGRRYEATVKEQFPNLAEENFIFEPHMRDVGPAIALVTSLLEKRFPNEPMAILWSDHLVKNIARFKNVLHLAEAMVKKNEAKFVFIGQKPRFANQNIGWIEVLKNAYQPTAGNDIYVTKFRKLVYRPSLSDAQDFLKKNNFVWNLGYFVTTPNFLSSLFSKFTPAMYKKLTPIAALWGTNKFEDALEKTYSTIEKISFDDAVLVKLQEKGIFVVSSDLGWSDVGAWESLKEALVERANENVVKGKVLLEDSKDSLVFNDTNQLVVGIDLDEMLVINTSDVILVCPKTSVPKIKKLVESLSGTPHEHLA